MNKLNDQDLMILARIGNPHAKPIQVGDLASRLLPYRPEFSTAAVARLMAMGMVEVRGNCYRIPDLMWIELCGALDRFVLPLAYGQMYHMQRLGFPVVGGGAPLHQCLQLVQHESVPFATFRYVGPDEAVAPPKYPLGRAYLAAVPE